MVDIQHKNITGSDAAHPPFYASESDPTTTLGAYRGWIKPSTGEVKVRNAANTAWIDLATTGAASALTDHLSDPSDAHDASAISFAPAGTIAATNVQAAIAEVATEAGGGGGGSAGHTIQDESSSMTARTNLNFVGAGVSVTDDSANDQTDVTIPGGSTDPASETVAGIAELATQTEVNTGTDTTRIVTPATLAGRTATETRAGVIEIATQSETNTGTDDLRALSAAKLAGRTASTTQTGIIELATQAETDTGTDATRAVTPSTLSNYSGLGGGGGSLTVKEDATSEGTGINSLNFTTNLDVSVSGTEATISATAGGGSAYRTLVTLGSDVVNSTTTYADVTGLSFAVTSGTMYRFEALLRYSTAITSAGIGLSTNGPASPTALAVTIRIPVTDSSTGVFNQITHNTADGNALFGTAAYTESNIAHIMGFVQPSASGTLVLRFKSETGGQAQTIRAGSTLEWW